MSNEAPRRAPKKRVALVLAEFKSTGDVLHAAEKVRDEGYQKWDVHTPFPIHGMDRAMGLSDSKLGWIVAVMALLGITSAIAMYYYMNGLDYAIVIGGKPGFSPPAAFPVYFELTVLFSAFGTVFGMFHLNQLPRHHHPVFESDRFAAATDDKYFISIEAEDGKFDVQKTKGFLESLHPSHVEVVEEVVS